MGGPLPPRQLRRWQAILHVSGFLTFSLHACRRAMLVL